MGNLAAIRAWVAFLDRACRWGRLRGPWLPSWLPRFISTTLFAKGGRFTTTCLGRIVEPDHAWLVGLRPCDCRGL